MSESVRSSVDPSHPLFAVGYAGPLRTRPVVTLSDGERREGQAAVAEETPVALVYNGRPHVVMMATPQDVEDLAIGFTLTEGIVAGPADIARVTVAKASHAIELQLEVPTEAGERLAARQRGMEARSGCGLCGVQAVEELLRVPPPVSGSLTIEAEALWRAGAALDERQAINRETHSVHAAAWATPDGALQVVREDVGRHNALDKVLGALARAGTDPRDGFLLVTSRASYELVQKAAVLGVPLLAAVSRPTGLAVRLAEATGMTLVALLRGRSANVYAHPERVR